MSAPQQALLMGRGGDPFFANVVSLVHFDDAPGTTIPVDVKSRFTWANDNPANAVVSSAVTKYGTGSLYRGFMLSPGGLYSNISGPPLSTTFTIEFYIYFTSFGPYGFTRFFRLNSNAGLNFLILDCDGAGQSFTINGASSAIAATTNNWYFITLCANGTDVKLYINGNLAVTLPYIVDFSLGCLLQIGNTAGPNGDYYLGYLDEFRYTNGIARYTTNFTPPTAPFPNY